MAIPMDLYTIKQRFSFDGDDETYQIALKREIESYFESESIPGSEQHETNLNQDLEQVNSVPPPSKKKKPCNTIILGSKPNGISVDPDTFDIFTKPHELNVILVDVQSYLQGSNRYCSICLTLFSDSSDYFNDHATFHGRKMPNTSQNNNSKSTVYQCSTCSNTFTSIFLLRIHIEQSYECHNAHFVNKPNNNNNNDEILRSPNNTYNKSNAKLSKKCFHCNKMFETPKFLIEHLYDILNDLKNTSDIQPVLKSILFKCHKCDIHFVSLQVAECHSEHMEMLINWKCSFCYRIFKKEDALNHERQHSVSNNFITYNLAEVDVNKILFKCYKCCTHFTEKAFMYHFQYCELETLQSVYCDICDILLDSTLKIVHESDHCRNDFNMRKLTVIETEVIANKSVDKFHIRRKVKELEQLCGEVKVVLHRLGANEPNARMKSDISYNNEFGSGLKTFDTLSLIIEEIHNNEEPKPRDDCLEAISPNSDIILRYDDDSDQSLDIEDIPQEINEMHNNKESEPMLESLESMSSNSSTRLVYDDSSSEAFEAVASKSDMILNVKKPEPVNAIFEPIPLCSVASKYISPELNKMMNNKESSRSNQKSDAIPVICLVALSEIPLESDNILNNEETEARVETFEADRPIIETDRPIIISDDSDCEIIESDLRTETISPKSKNMLHNRHKAVDKVEKRRRLRKRKSFMQCFNRNQIFKRKLRKRAVVKKMPNKINRKRSLSKIKRKRAMTTNCKPTDNTKRPNVSYFYCNTCKCFVTNFKKCVHRQRRCKNTVQVVCTFCGLVSTSNGSLTHNKLHNKNQNLKIWDFKIYNIHNNQIVKPPLPKYPICVNCNVHFVTKGALINHTCKVGEYLFCKECEIKLSEAAFKLHMEYHSYLQNDYEKFTIQMVDQSINNLDHGSNEGKAIDNVINSQIDEDNASSLKDKEILYTCRNCDVTVDTYDKMIEHCQGHYVTEEKAIETEICTICQLHIDRSCYLNHHSMHKKGNSMKVLKFDSYYFPSENQLWINHVFKTVPQEKVTEILSKSIYRFEGRIKMDIVQQGPPDLTVYKCDQCCCFIDSSSIYKHSENSCFKLRRRFCTICNLPFNSAESQIKHEKVHQRPGITLKSYRIVLFNQERDKQLNSSFYFRKRYVLYLCRNCGGIIDILKLENHQCDKNDLKKCPQCRLFLYSREYEAHAKIHEEFDSFNDRNMKVILLGKVKKCAAKVEKTVRCNFQGLIYDYKIYKCKKCQLCVKNEKCIPKHACHLEKKQFRCPVCSLLFSVSRLKTHLRNHESDSFYLLSNMTIVSFDPSSYDLNKNTTTASRNGDCGLLDSNTDSDSDVVTRAEENNTYNKKPFCGVAETEKEEMVKLYKCDCGLHFLNEASIQRHFGVCKSKSRASKQMCPKCNLLFSTNILFTHLLAHHTNGNSRYKYEIIRVSAK